MTPLSNGVPPPPHQYMQQPPPPHLASMYPHQPYLYAMPLQQQQQPQMLTPPNMMNNSAPSPNTQGLYSTYPARLKQSKDNALLLPSSYLVDRKTRFPAEDDYEDDLLESADDSDEGASSSLATSTIRGGASTVRRVGQTGSTGPELTKVQRKKNHIYPGSAALEQASILEEVLVPIRLDIDLDDVRLRDVFLWNMNEQFLTPEKFAQMLCDDLSLPTSKFMPLIAESIRTQVLDFETVHLVELPAENIRVVINLDLQIGKINLRDRFEWDLANTASNAPEVFSKQLASEVGLGGEYSSIIAHAIREQLYRHKRQWIDESLSDQITAPLSNGFRTVEDAEGWTPQMDILSNEELEKLLIAQERNMRRLRRETRFKRSRRH